MAVTEKMRLNVACFGFALEPQVNCIATDIKQLARLTFLETIQLNRLHYFLPEVITVRFSHWNRVDPKVIIILYVLTLLAIAILAVSVEVNLKSGSSQFFLVGWQFTVSIYEIE